MPMYNALQRIIKHSQATCFYNFRSWSNLLVPKLVPFEISEAEAREKFHEWQASRWLAPRNLLESPDVNIRAVYLPFWCFETRLSFTYSAIPATKFDSGKYHRNERITGSLPAEWFLSSLPETQIYASYKYRRDFTEAVKLNELPENVRLLTALELERWKVWSEFGDELRELDRPTMRQGIAWELALRLIRNNKTEELTRSVLERTKASNLLEMHLGVEVLTRKVSLIYFPSYVVNYTFTRSYSSSGELRANQFEGVVSGSKKGRVLGERHYSPYKAQMAASMVGGTLGTSMAFVTDTSLLVETCFWSFMASIAAGMYARFSTMMDRWNQLHSADLNHQKFTKQYFNDFMEDKDGAFSDFQDSLRCESEWSQWEDLKKWNWKEEERRNWCEALWREQHRRRRKNLQFKIKTEQEKIKRKWEEEREARRRRKFGDSARYPAGSGFQWRRTAGGRKDPFGFYALLGLNPKEKINEEKIKEAFKKQAMRWHPDLHAVQLRNSNGSQVDISQRLKKFQSLQQAYEVLRDPEKKRLYDRGELLRQDL